MLRQSSIRLAEYCCLNHVIIWGISLVCFNILGHHFGTFILIDQIYESYLTIDSIDDLANFLDSTSANISMVANENYLTWKLLESSQDTNFQKIYKKLIHKINFGYDEIYHGRRIAINYRFIFESVISTNKHLGFHLSGDQYFGSAIVLLYSKTINNTLKDRIDSVVYSLFESGIQDLWWNLFNYNRVNIEQDWEDNRTLTMKSIRGLLILSFGINLLLIYFLILENLYKFQQNK